MHGLLILKSTPQGGAESFFNLPTYLAFPSKFPAHLLGIFDLCLRSHWLLQSQHLSHQNPRNSACESGMKRAKFRKQKPLNLNLNLTTFYKHLLRSAKLSQHVLEGIWYEKICVRTRKNNTKSGEMLKSCNILSKKWNERAQIPPKFGVGLRPLSVKRTQGRERRSACAGNERVADCKSSAADKIGQT